MDQLEPLPFHHYDPMSVIGAFTQIDSGEPRGVHDEQQTNNMLESVTA